MFAAQDFATKSLEVTAGDTFQKIAQRCKITVQQLKEANPQIQNPNTIKAGENISVPFTADCCKSPQITWTSE